MNDVEWIDQPSPNFDERGGLTPDLLVLHYTGMRTGEAALSLLCDREPRPENYSHAIAGPVPIEMGRVSAHYMVEEDGRVFRLVRDDKRAWHAGVSSWDGAEDINARSIGIEVVNGGHDFDLPEFTPEQIDALGVLCRALMQVHAIAPWRVVGHAEIAPGRKRDPGPRFPWAALATQAGVGFALPKPPGPFAPDPAVRPGDEGEVVARVQSLLRGWGYPVTVDGRYAAQTDAVVRAFKERWGRVTGAADEPDAFRPRDAWALEVLFGCARIAAQRAAAAGRPFAGAAPAPLEASFT